jgi:hypothetical protein
MRIAFASSHVTGNYRSGHLTVGVCVEDDALGQTTWDTIEFAVPPDFHTHNDAVASALMTLVGRKYDEVEFNFPISTTCWETLGAYYGELAIGPVDPAAEPRRPGRRLGLNFSGGLDSTAGWLLLRELYGDDFAVVTSEYGGRHEFEALAYSQYQRDVSCRTNLRQKRYNLDGRFNFCVPLLFADYLDLWGIATGHILIHTHDWVIDFPSGGRPAFLLGDLVVNAGGLEEVHLLRSLSAVGVARVLLTLGPERIEAAMAASSPPKGGKAFLGAWIMRLLHADAGLPAPPFLDDYPPQQMAFGDYITRVLYLYKREGPAAIAQYCPAMLREEMRVLDELSLRLLERYNPSFVALLPTPLDTRLPALLQECGIQPYDAHDWEELAALRLFLQTHLGQYFPSPAG